MRAFVAIPLPDSFASWLAMQRPVLGALADGLRVVPPASAHITLRFLGDLPAAQVPSAMERLRASLAAKTATTLVLDRLGVFYRQGYPSVLWVGPASTPAEAEALASAVTTGLTGLGSNRRPEPFVPHVTIARFNGHGPELPLPLRLPPVQPLVVPVSKVVLYESVLGTGTPTYVPQGAVELAPFAEGKD
ncbi:MAG: RNA 2',3'-cyclic phosphodiesterase [Candidatus Cryosericum sp.]|jgi:2'-5' RNA ligase|nr:RNA 2',3'-cyclic phosphodiesterase [Candidatus Cryosericum sp.]HPS69581.1 RNA 2',3'-cyclic phosphodiesterase [Candidatus Cryosericum sp.]